MKASHAVAGLGCGGLLVAVLLPVVVAVAAVGGVVGSDRSASTGLAGVCVAEGARELVVPGNDGRGERHLSAAQVGNAAVIIGVGRERGLSEKLILVALQTAIGESNLQNLANDGSFRYPPGTTVMTATEWAQAREVAMTSLALPNDGTGSDWDSVGLFQQRPQAGWGTVPELMDPAIATGKFYDAALRVAGWESLANVEIIRQVQRSVNPYTYSRFEAAAAALLAEADLDCQSVPMLGDGVFVSPLPGRGISSHFGSRVHPITGVRQSHAGVDLPAPSGTPIHAAAAGTVTRVGCESWQGRSPCQVVVDHGAGIETWYVHMYPHGVLVAQGQHVAADQVIAEVGSNGQSTGPHLHFEIHVDGAPVDPQAFYRDRGVPLG